MICFRLLIVCCAVLTYPPQGLAAFELSPLGGRPTGLGGICAALPADGWAALVNPALLATMPSRSVWLAYSPGLFGMRELEGTSLLFAQPSALGTFSAAVSRFGFRLYRETTLSLGYGYLIAGRLGLGVAVHAYLLSIAGYGSAKSLGVDIGLRLPLSGAVTYGCTVTNVNGPRIGRDKEPLPSMFSMGVCLVPLADCLIELDIVKDLHFPPEIRLGSEYCPVEALAIRLGMCSDPSTFAGGIGLRISSLLVDYSVDYHLHLGPSHHVSVAIPLD